MHIKYIINGLYISAFVFNIKIYNLSLLGTCLHTGWLTLLFGGEFPGDPIVYHQDDPGFSLLFTFPRATG